MAAGFARIATWCSHTLLAAVNHRRVAHAVDETARDEAQNGNSLVLIWARPRHLCRTKAMAWLLSACWICKSHQPGLVSRRPAWWLVFACDNFFLNGFSYAPGSNQTRQRAIPLAAHRCCPHQSRCVCARDCARAVLRSSVALSVAGKSARAAGATQKGPGCEI